MAHGPAGYRAIMERSSDKHGPRVDEGLKHEPEGPVIVDPNLPAGSLTHEEVELRRDLARFLERNIFPATKEAIVEEAAEMGAPDNLVAWFKRLPSGTYEGFPEVWERGSGHTEPRK
jgi:hypothetical protein